jgi:hypothetical protein
MHLTIRPDQLRALGLDRRRQYLEKLAARLRLEFPATFDDLSEEDTRQFILDGIDYAADYGLTSDEHVEIYLELMARFGRRFDAFCPWAGPILRLKLPPEQKIEGLNKASARAIEEQFGAGDVLI